MVKSILTRKKSQAWGIDLMAAITIFTVGILSIYIYSINFSDETEDTLNELYYRGRSASSLLLSEGNPDNWSKNNVEIPGILSQKKINQTNLEMLNNISQENYQEVTYMLGLGYGNEFYFNFPGMEIEGEKVNGIGKKPEDPENLIKIKRVTIYQNKPTKLNLFIWN